MFIPLDIHFGLTHHLVKFVFRNAFPKCLKTLCKLALEENKVTLGVLLGYSM